MPHAQPHKQHRVGWLRAAVLGANDGIISISSLIIGVAAAGSSNTAIAVSGIAGVIAGAISMAAGEYVSVCTQADTEKSDLLIEAQSLEDNYEEEIAELAEIYENRGVEKALAIQVAKQMMEHDALATHARDDIGISEESSAQPLQAAMSSAACFVSGAFVPLLFSLITPLNMLIPTVSASSLLMLAILGAVSAYLSGAKLYIGVLRITFWGAIAMLVTALTGAMFDVWI
ncbi:VIT1/CCC1 transporter family protein [Glaciecola sp. 2405UD65-10]|uniref:VIT1/CCC1 transporter family protein n=1 Tax=Glaciecola sp. 2405UD65-10 TaxID=3397244 RepID=UPI003B5A7190